jgi:hypothetical protein
MVLDTEHLRRARVAFIHEEEHHLCLLFRVRQRLPNALRCAIELVEAVPIYGDRGLGRSVVLDRLVEIPTLQKR